MNEDQAQADNAEYTLGVHVRNQAVQSGGTIGALAGILQPYACRCYVPHSRGIMQLARGRKCDQARYITN